MKTIKVENALAIPSYDLGGILPDLNDMEVIPIDLIEDYWTPEKPGESKRLYFKEVVETERKDEQTGTPYIAEIAYFIEQQSDGSHKQITNQSIKLVTAMKSINPGTPLQITYLGKKRTQSGNQMDSWHISPLVRRGNHATLVQPQIEEDDDIFGEAS